MKAPSCRVTSCHSQPQCTVLELENPSDFSQLLRECYQLCQLKPRTESAHTNNP